MADFAIAIGKTLLAEGGYSNDSSDSGGETYRGISRKNWPNWSGWSLIDKWHDATFSYDIKFPSCLDTDTALQGSVIDFYRKNFWQYDGLIDQGVANKEFDLSVNVGKVHAIKILQQLIDTKADGVYGPATEELTNLHPQGSLTPLIRAAASAYHRQIVQTHPEDAKFLEGWLRRDAA